MPFAPLSTALSKVLGQQEDLWIKHVDFPIPTEARIDGELTSGGQVFRITIVGPIEILLELENREIINASK